MQLKPAKQINVRLSVETYEKLLALANGWKHKTCPTCGKTWDLQKQTKPEPVPFSVLSKHLLEDAIVKAFNKRSYGSEFNDNE